MAITGSTIIPTLRYHDAHAAIDWLESVLGFTRKAVYEGPNKTVAHAELTRGRGMVMLGSVTDADTAYARRWIDLKETGGRETSGFYVITESDDECVAVYERAKAAGAKIVQELTSPSYGGKSFTCCDPEGHAWSLGSYNPWNEHAPAAEGTA